MSLVWRVRLLVRYLVLNCGIHFPPFTVQETKPEAPVAVEAPAPAAAPEEPATPAESAVPKAAPKRQESAEVPQPPAPATNG